MRKLTIAISEFIHRDRDNNLFYRGIFLIVAGVIMLSCVPALPPEPITIDCYGFTDGNTIVSENHCLRGPYTMDTSNGIIQAVPDGWQMVNVLTTANDNPGTLTPDDYTDYARITSNGFGITFELHNAVDGINGQWGYSQNVNLTPGCHLGKVSGQDGTNDPPHRENYVVSFYFDEALLSQQELPAQSGFEFIYPFWVEVAGEYPVRFMVAALWGSAGHGSKVDILGAGVLSVEDGYCE